MLEGQSALDWMKNNPNAGYSNLNADNSVQSTQEGDKGWLGNILFGLAKPFINAGRAGGQLGQDVLSGITGGRVNAGNQQSLTGEERANMPEFLTKTAAGIGADAVGGSIPGLVAGGALQSLSNQRIGTPVDVGDIIKGAAIGGGTGLLMHGAGGILGNMRNNFLEKSAAQAGDTALAQGATNAGEEALQKAAPEQAANNFGAENKNNAFRGDNTQAQNALNDFYTRSGKGTLDLANNKGLPPAEMASNLKGNLSNLEDYRLNLKDAGTITDNKITPDNIGKIQSAAGQDIASKVKAIDENGLIKPQSALGYIDGVTQGLKGIDQQEALNEADALVKEFRVSKEGALTAEDYKAIKQGTDSFSQKYNKLDLTQQQAFANRNKVALALNDSARQTLVAADPTIQKSLQTYSFIQQNAPDLKKAFVGNMQNNIIPPRFTKAGILRSAVNGLQDVNKQSLIDQAAGEAGGGILGRIKSAASNIPMPAANVPQPLINTLQNPLIQKGVGILSNMSPQAAPQKVGDAQAASKALEQSKTDNQTQQQQFTLASRLIKDGATPAQLQAIGINIPGLSSLSGANTKAAELQQAKTNALKVVQQAEQMLPSLNQGSGILGKLSGAVSNALPSSDVKAYNTFVNANASILAKAFGVNSTSKSEMQKFIDALPSPTDTTEEAQAKLDTLYSSLKA